MKKGLIAVFFVFAAVVSAHSQNNTFPSSGNVGIGTVSPGTWFSASPVLQINGTRPTINFTPTSANGVATIQFKGPSNLSEFHLNFVDGSNSSIFLHSYQTGGDIFRFKGNGNIGIGTSDPGTKLDVRGTIRTFNATSEVVATWDNLSLWSDGSKSFIESNGDEDGLFIKSNAGNKVIFESMVGIGTTAPDSKLTVKGVIHAEEVKVNLAVPGPDYVFDESYPLRSLEDTKTYIDQNKHLPGIPSSDEMRENGVNLLEMNMKLLEKVEELTLHLIEQDRRNNTLQTELLQLKEEMKELKSAVK